MPKHTQEIVNNNNNKFCFVFEKFKNKELTPYVLNAQNTEIHKFCDNSKQKDFVIKQQDKNKIFKKPLLCLNHNFLNTYEMLCYNVSYSARKKCFVENKNFFSVILLTTIPRLENLDKALDIVSISVFCNIPYKNFGCNTLSQKQIYSCLKDAKCNHVYVDYNSKERILSLIKRLTTNKFKNIPSAFICFDSKIDKIVLLNHSFNNYVKAAPKIDKKRFKRKIVENDTKSFKIPKLYNAIDIEQLIQNTRKEIENNKIILQTQKDKEIKNNKESIQTFYKTNKDNKSVKVFSYINNKQKTL